jgi:hypothetical protein
MSDKVTYMHGDWKPKRTMKDRLRWLLYRGLPFAGVAVAIKIVSLAIAG